MKMAGTNQKKRERLNHDKWSMRRLRYLQEWRRPLYTELLTTGELEQHLVDVQKAAWDLWENLFAQMSPKEGITEELKARDPMEWVQRYNNLSNRLDEIVNDQIIYA